ncbi:hypothetical protein HZS_7770 [Henneguya salminicola]|nr:hypothetical protein HZS_7770 [Henneguya salminicola]
MFLSFLLLIQFGIILNKVFFSTNFLGLMYNKNFYIFFSEMTLDPNEEKNYLLELNNNTHYYGLDIFKKLIMEEEKFKNLTLIPEAAYQFSSLLYDEDDDIYISEYLIRHEKSAINKTCFKISLNFIGAVIMSTITGLTFLAFIIRFVIR